MKSSLPHSFLALQQDLYIIGWYSTSKSYSVLTETNGCC